MSKILNLGNVLKKINDRIEDLINGKQKDEFKPWVVLFPVVYIWYIILKLLKGKTIFIGGYPLSGKSTLAHYISHNGKPPKNQTVSNEELKVEHQFELKDLKLKIIIDGRHHVEGDTYKEAKEGIEKADIVFYMFNAKQIMDNDLNAIKTMSKEIKLFNDFCKDKDTILVAIGTHIDMIDGFSPSVLKNLKSFMQPLEEKSIIANELKNLDNFSRLFYGSLKKEYIKKITFDILKYVSEKIKKGEKA